MKSSFRADVSQINQGISMTMKLIGVLSEVFKDINLEYVLCQFILHSFFYVKGFLSSLNILYKHSSID